MLEQKISELITLKLENNQINLYINNELFILCKKLLLSIPIKNAIDTEFNSIDEFETFSTNYKNIKIPIEEEFWGHCSNLLVWVENNYDTRILHRNLSFPLLRELSRLGDKIARKRYKEEIVSRFFEDNSGNIRLFLLPYFKDFIDLELESILCDDLQVWRGILIAKLGRAFCNDTSICLQIDYENRIYIYRIETNVLQIKSNLIDWEKTNFDLNTKDLGISTDDKLLILRFLLDEIKEIPIKKTIENSMYLFLKEELSRLKSYGLKKIFTERYDKILTLSLAKKLGYKKARFVNLDKNHYYIDKVICLDLTHFHFLLKKELRVLLNNANISKNGICLASNSQRPKSKRGFIFMIINEYAKEYFIQNDLLETMQLSDIAKKCINNFLKNHIEFSIQY